MECDWKSIQDYIYTAIPATDFGNTMTWLLLLPLLVVVAVAAAADAAAALAGCCGI